MRKVKVLYASSEVVPYSKTGGLGDVAGALPSALKAKGVDVAVITPLYRGIRKRFRLKDTKDYYSIQVSSNRSEAGIFEHTSKTKPTVYFVDCEKYYDREELYTTKEGDYPDNAERFVFFSRLIVEFAQKHGFDIIHLNDWQTAMAAVYAKVLYNFQGKTVLTIHNLGYQGLFWHFDMHLTNLDWSYFNPKALEFWGKINFLKGGIYFSDAVTTVSPTYAKEILTEKDGFGLHGVLNDVKDRLYGILNGIDYREWSPEKDRYISRKYNIETVTEGKKACKKALLKNFGLEERLDVPVVGMISRLTYQKGFDLLKEAACELMKRELFLIILGSGEKEYEEAVKSLKDRFPHKTGVYLGFSNELAHRIEAGADFFLMPSRYEPCGLNQMISMAYGTIPIVAAVGGLNDTVIDIDEEGGCGIKFSIQLPEKLIEAVDRAVALYKNKRLLGKVRRTAMAKDFSWNGPAEKYRELYLSLKG